MKTPASSQMDSSGSGLSRRTMGATLAGLAAVPFVPRGAAAGLGVRQAEKRNIIKPPRLKPGNTIGLVNPATAAFETMPIEILKESLEAMGLEVVLGDSYFDKRGYFAGKDEDRAGDINRFFADKNVHALLARGGWGSARLLDHLDYETIQANPKVLIGYSDVTALLLGIHAKTGLVTFHGPQPRDVLSAEWMKRVLFDAESPVLENPSEIASGLTVQTQHRIRTLRPGKARGPILGGNLTVLSGIVGSDYLPQWDGAILFLEDVNEAVYRIDRMMTQLRLAGILDRISGFVFGRCSDCDSGTSFGSLTLEQVLRDHIEPLGIPAFEGALIGHMPKQWTVPLGVEVELDADRGTVKLLEAGVI